MEHTFTLTYLFNKPNAPKTPTFAGGTFTIVCAGNEPFVEQDVLAAAAQCFQTAISTTKTHNPHELCEIITRQLGEELQCDTVLVPSDATCAVMCTTGQFPLTEEE